MRFMMITNPCWRLLAELARQGGSSDLLNNALVKREVFRPITDFASGYFQASFLEVVHLLEEFVTRSC